MLLIETDATFHENSHVVGLSAILHDQAGNVKLAIGKRVKANNIVVGELMAILFALEEIPENGAEVRLQSDNQNAVAFLNGTAFAADDEMQVVQKIRNRIDSKQLRVEFTWSERKNNFVADAVATLSSRYSSVWARP